MQLICEKAVQIQRMIQAKLEGGDIAMRSTKPYITETQGEAARETEDIRCSKLQDR